MRYDGTTTWVVSREMKDLSPGDTDVPFSAILGTSL